MADHIDVMISSTARDLPEHRAQAREACLFQGMHPIMMEHLPASDDDAMTASYKLVDQAEIYLAIIGFSYGSIPNSPRNPKKLSYTELEYHHAKERQARGDKVERMIFIMSDKHMVAGGSVEKGSGAKKLEKFKKLLRSENIVVEFDSPVDLGKRIIDSLSKSKLNSRDAVNTIHPYSDIPTLPNEYIAHRYSLMETSRLIGRKAELNLLTDWVSKPGSEIGAARVVNVVAIGGMGKSALTWEWFTQNAPQEMKPLTGRMWWSFYESNATYEAFIYDALAYCGGMTREAARALGVPDAEQRLLRLLDQQPFLLALDGLERILIAYSRTDATRLRDDEVESDAHKRKSIDPRAGRFLKALRTVRASRILISTRLLPAELEDAGGKPLPGCYAHKLEGLADDDALELWREFGVRSARDQVLPVFRAFGMHPLLIQVLAGEIAGDMVAAGDYERWRAENPTFDPFSHETLAASQAHVLAFALRGLNDDQRKVLHTLAAFRMPASGETLKALFVGEDKLCAQASVLHGLVRDLRDRGLVGWDAGANRYDLHPIVRGVVWSAVDGEARTAIFTTMEGHFSALPVVEYEQVERLEDLTSAIQLYHTLVDLGRYDDAYLVFRDRLAAATLHRLSSARQRVEMLERLFPDGLDQLPRLSKPGDQAYTLNALALAYDTSGQPAAAAPLYRRTATIYEVQGEKAYLSIGLCNLSEALRLSGALHDAEAAVRRALGLSRETGDAFMEAASLQWLGLAMAARGVGDDDAVGGGGDVGAQYDRAQGSEEVPAGDIAPLHRTSPHVTLQTPSPANPTDDLKAFRRAIDMFRRQNKQQMLGVSYASLAQAYLWRGDAGTARRHADRAWELAGVRRQARDFVRAARLQGAAAVGVLKPSPPSPPSARIRASHTSRTESPDAAVSQRDGGEGVSEDSSRGATPKPLSPVADRALVSLESSPRRVGEGLGVRASEDLSTLADYADERLHFAITKAREINYAEDELPALVALAELRRLQGRTEEARERLGEVWEGAERGPFPLFHADALNVLAQIERDAGNRDAAIAAATQAYTLAWCDGISADGSVGYAYAYGLRNARAHLEALGAPIPSLPPFSFDGREGMPEVEIDPDDEWHVGDRRVEEEL